MQYWEQNKSEDYYSIAFGKKGLKIFNEYEMLLFPIWHQSHFFLLVGFPKRERWEFYNNLDNDADWSYTRHFVSVSLLTFIYLYFSISCTNCWKMALIQLGQWEKHTRSYTHFKPTLLQEKDFHYTFSQYTH